MVSRSPVTTLAPVGCQRIAPETVAVVVRQADELAAEAPPPLAATATPPPTTAAAPTKMRGSFEPPPLVFVAGWGLADAAGASTAGDPSGLGWRRACSKASITLGEKSCGLSVRSPARAMASWNLAFAEVT